MALILSLSCFGATKYWYESSSSSADLNSGKKPVAFVEKTKDEIHRRPVTRIIWQLINEGEPVFPGEAIRTSSVGEVRIQFADSSRFIDLEPDSLIVISQASNNEISLDLMDGGLMVNQGGGEESAEGSPALTLNSGKAKVDLSKATASMSKSTSGNIDLQVLKGKATVGGQDGKVQEIGSGSVGSLGTQFNAATLKILSPSLVAPFFINPGSPETVQFSWNGFPENSKVSLQIGISKRDLKERGLSKGEPIRLRLPIGKYSWKLVATDPATNQTLGESPVYRLEVAPRFPPVVISPVQGETLLKTTSPNKVHFQWLAPENSQAILLEVSTDLNFQNKTLSQKFRKEDFFDVELDEGDYFLRTGALYEGLAEPAFSKVQKFRVSSKPVIKSIAIDWINAIEESPQYFALEPTANLEWSSDQKDQVKAWRVKLAATEEDLASPEAKTFETQDLKAKAPLPKPGRYLAMVEALDDRQKVIGSSSVKAVRIEPYPLLPAPRFSPESGDLRASNDGRLDLQWNEIPGAKNYKIRFLDAKGVELRSGQFSRASTSLVNLMPGEYQIQVVAIDGYGRESQKLAPRKVSVPDSSNLAVPKVRKIKVK